MAIKMIKKLLLAVIILGLAASFGYCQEQPLQLTIKSDKEVYEVGESIYINYRITNVSKNRIKIAPPFGEKGVIDPNVFGGSFLIKRESDENSTEIFPLADIGWRGVSPNEVVTIKKGESYEKKVDIIKIDQKSHLKDIPYSSEYYLRRKGKYTIIGKYGWLELRKNYPTPDCWKGAFTSNTITIEVVERKGISKEEAIKLVQDYIKEQNISVINIDAPSEIIEYDDYWYITYKYEREQIETSPAPFRIFTVYKDTGKIVQLKGM